MKLDEASPKPLFVQIGEIIEDMIISGDLQAGEQVFSTNQLSESFKINPATARKGLNQLVDKGILYKKRGLGMFVQKGAAGKIKKERKKHFYEHYLSEMMNEAKKLSISKAEIIEMISKTGEGD